MRRYSIIVIAAFTALVFALLAILPGSWRQAPLFDNVTNIELIPIKTQRPNFGILKIGHRGTTLYGPENTLPALEKAIEMGFEYLEIDVRFSSDGIPVLIHDSTLDRTTNGSGKVDEYTLAELKELDAGFWFSDEFVGARIPTLEEALQLLQGRACVVWDTKASKVPDEATIKLFQRYGFDRDCLLIGLALLSEGRDIEAARQIVRYWPNAPLAPIVRNIAEITAALDEFPNIRAVRVARYKVSDELVDAAHAKGILVISHAFRGGDRAATYKKFIDRGVDMLMLDYIEDFYTYLETGNIDTPGPPAPKNAEYSPANW